MSIPLNVKIYKNDPGNMSDIVSGAVHYFAHTLKPLLVILLLAKLFQCFSLTSWTQLPVLRCNTAAFKQLKSFSNSLIQ